MLHIYYGNGKGKTTAAVGLAIRALGNQYPVIFLQFLKGRDSGEIVLLKAIENCIVLRNSVDYGFYKNMGEQDKKAVFQMHMENLSLVREYMKKKAIRLIVLDEIFSAYHYKLFDTEAIWDIVDKGREDKENIDIVCTGRNPDPIFLEKADYITEMKKIQHPYDNGITARRGIEY